MDFRRINTKQLYVMESVDYIKIGISSDAVKRLGYLNAELPREKYFSILKIKFCEDRFECQQLEKYLHNKYSDFQRITNILGAKTECFSKEILEDLLDSLDSMGDTYVYDPFITVSNNHVPDILGKSWKELYQICGLSRSFEVRFTRAIRNLAANVIRSSGRIIFYNEGLLETFGVVSTMTRKVFEILWPKFTSKTTTAVAPVKLLKLNNRPKYLNRFRSMTKSYLSCIESLKEYKMGGGDRQDKYLTKINEYINEQIMGNADNCIVEVK